MWTAVLFASCCAPAIDFDTEVLPVLTRAGCNAGACHGAAAGRGGFRLSLFGGDPAADYRAIVHDLEGRRVNLTDPEQSLLLRKPTWELDHEGGQRFESESPFARVLVDWVRGGARRAAEPRRLVNLTVAPREATIEAIPAQLELTVKAVFSDGASRDFGELAVFTPADPASTEVDSRGVVRVLRPGRHTIIVRFLTEVAAVQVTAPFPGEPIDLSSAPRGNWIDDEIYRALAGLRLPPSPPADTATLLRRVTLDLTGRLPSPERVQEFLVDDRPLAEKYAAEVDRLLASDKFTQYWTYRYATWLAVRTGPNDDAGTRAYHAWIREQIASDRPLADWLAELVTAEGDSHQHGPANFHRSAANARDEAEHFAESLLGIRLRCANCHNHPLDRWTQDDYHGLAAIFARLDRGQIIRQRATGDVIHPATGEAAIPRVPGERFIDPAADGRQALAAWLTAPDNRYFARAWANRLWESMFGRGLVHPSDDLRDTNPATHPALLDRLAADFAENRFDLRHTLRLMAQSSAYQRGKVPSAPESLAASESDNRFYSKAPAKPIPMPILLRLVCQITDVHVEEVELPGSHVSTKASTAKLQDLRPRIFDPLDLAGCTGKLRSERDDPLPASLDEMSAQLAWLNGPLLNAKLTDKQSAFGRIAGSRAPTRQLIEEYYLRTLSRLPRKEETSYWQKQITGTTRGKSCEDFAWALLSCPEFVTNQ
jgi:hypothetical protein